MEPLFLSVEKDKIINEKKESIHLKGVNLGGWLMMEGYILYGRNIPEHQFKKKFENRLGRNELLTFEDLYYSNFITEKDIKRISQLGFNCVRIPFNYRILKEWIKVLDNVIYWAKKYKIYVILDMHAAPGCQNPDWHSDSNGRIRLFKNKKYQDRTIQLWDCIAKRYKNEGTIAGYDLLNEPVVKNPYKDLVPFYKRLITTIRESDINHIIFLEANNWSIDIECLKKINSVNLIYSIHFYPPIDFTFNFVRNLSYPGIIGKTFWDKKRLKSLLKRYYSFSKKLKIPIFIGEFGVNFRGKKIYGECRWVKDCIDIFEEFGFHWCYWTFKAVSNSIFPDGIYQYENNPPWIKRQGPVMGWETLLYLWKEKRKEIIDSWRTESFVKNSQIINVLIPQSREKRRR